MCAVYVCVCIAMMCKFSQKPNRKCQANLFCLRRSIFSALFSYIFWFICLFVCVFSFFFSLFSCSFGCRKSALVHCTPQNTDNFGTMLFQILFFSNTIFPTKERRYALCACVLLFSFCKSFMILFVRRIFRRSLRNFELENVASFYGCTLEFFKQSQQNRNEKS